MVSRCGVLAEVDPVEPLEPLAREPLVPTRVEPVEPVDPGRTCSMTSTTTVPCMNGWIVQM